MKLILTAITLTITALFAITGAHAETKSYDFSDSAQRRAAQQAIYDTYTKQNVERLVKSLEKAVQYKSSYAQQAQDALPSLKALQSALPN